MSISRLRPLLRLSVLTALAWLLWVPDVCLAESVVGKWRVEVEGEARARLLDITAARRGPNEVYALQAHYGWADEPARKVAATLDQSQSPMRLHLVTPASSQVEAQQVDADSFKGTIRFKSGKTSKVDIKRIAADVTSPSRVPDITFVHLGGSDCPSCVLWRAIELPKLKAAPEFATVRFVYVAKTIKSPVPSAMFFPDDAKDVQPLLAEAGNGRTGSPYQAFLVNGKVAEYWFGPGRGSAEDILNIVRALQAGKRYPREGCVKLKAVRGCEIRN